MKKIIVILLVLAQFAKAQPYDTYRWVQHSGDNYVKITRKIWPTGKDTVTEVRMHYYTDTVAMRQEITGLVAQLRNQSAEAFDLYERLDAKADSLYAVLQDLNDGFGALDGDLPLREPQAPDEGYKKIRWTAILPKTGVLKAG